MYNVEDFKNDTGEWVRSFRPFENVNHVTRSGALWNALEYRTKVGNKIAQKSPTYLGCTNDFGNYQLFTDWCQQEYGYMRKDSRGFFWALDKDILNFGNKSYSPETCIFVPCSVNSLFTRSESTRGELPQGVTYAFKKGRYIAKAQCKDINNKTKHLGYFEDPVEAHRAWQKYKVSVLERYKYHEELKDHYKFQLAVERHIQRIQTDYSNFKLTD